MNLREISATYLGRRRSRLILLLLYTAEQLIQGPQRPAAQTLASRMPATRRAA